MKRLVLLISIVALLFGLTGCKNTSESIMDIYPEIKDDSYIRIADKEDIIAMIKHGTGVVFFSWRECPWCHFYIENLNDICIDNKLEYLYYDIHDDRENNTDFYKELVSLLNDSLEESSSFDSNGKLRIYVPDVYFIVEGEVIFHDNSSSRETDYDNNHEAYWNETVDGNKRIDIVLNSLKEAAETVKEKKTELDNQGCNTSCKVERD